jgi:type IV secretory pathway TrbF-like protein
MVQVDRLGEAQAVAPAIANFRPPDPRIGWHLARFIEQVRGIASEVRRYTDADQQAEYQGDRFFEYVPALQEAEIRLPAQ